MVIELLYPEICNLYGDSGNIMFMEATFEDAVFIKTSLNDEPHFVKNDVDLVYMGSLTANNQLIVIEKLTKYKERIAELIESGKVFLFTGNAMEVMGDEIKQDDGRITKALSLLRITTAIHLSDRYNSLVLGKFEAEGYDTDKKIVGYISKSSTVTEGEAPLFSVEKQANGKVSDGVRHMNFFGTSLLGPILILNPAFAKYIFSLIGYFGPLVFEEEVERAYIKRVAEYSDDNIKFDAH